MQSVSIPVRRVDEIVENVATERPDVVFLSGVTPFGMARAHRLYRTLRARYPHLRLMVGIWGYTDEVGKAAQKISRGDAVPIATTLAAAVTQIRSTFVAAETPLTSPAESSAANAA
jgi:hypothetical protein